MFSWGDRVGNLYWVQKLGLYMHNTKYTKIESRLIKYAKGKKNCIKLQVINNF